MIINLKYKLSIFIRFPIQFVTMTIKQSFYKYLVRGNNFFWAENN